MSILSLNLPELIDLLNEQHELHSTEVVELGVLVHGDIYSVESITYNDGIIYLQLNDN